MPNFFKKSLLATALVAAATSAMAANSIDLKVSGKIVPSSCTPAFGSGGGIADFGTIKVSALNSTSATALPDIKLVPVTITCEESTRFAVKFTDARHASAATEDYTITFTGGFAGHNGDYFGLGTYKDNNIGSYMLLISRKAGTLTNAAGENLLAYFSQDNGVNWGVNGDDKYSPVVSDNSRIYSFGTEANKGPQPQTLVNLSLGVTAIINPTNDLNVTDEANLDGLTNIELVYL